MSASYRARVWSDYYNSQKVAEERSSAQERASVRRMLVDMALLDCTVGQREVIRRRLGMDGYHPHTWQEIADAMGQSARQSAHQMYQNGMKRLRKVHGDGLFSRPLRTVGRGKRAATG